MFLNSKENLFIILQRNIFTLDTSDLMIYKKGSEATNLLMIWLKAHLLVETTNK